MSDSHNVQISGHGRFSLTLADAVIWLTSMPTSSVDLVITDPPYESLEKHRARGTTTRLSKSKSSSNEWFQIFPNSRFEELFREIYRVLKKNTHFYLFCDPETMFLAKPIAEKVGFKFWKPVIWDKKLIGMGYHYRARYECILFFEKGKRRLNNLAVADVIEYPRIRNGYPTEKPIEVIKTFIDQSTNVSEIVVDPFMGSGSTGVAAIQAGRHFLGCDIYQPAFDIARTRLEQADSIKPQTLTKETGTIPNVQLSIRGL